MKKRKALMSAALITFATLCWPSAALADGEPTRGGGLCNEFGVTLWGLSNHLKHHDFDYHDKNYGAGLRCYGRPGWRALGSRDDTQLFFQLDALADSRSGLLFPVSLGVEHHVADISVACQVFAEGALTLAYYGHATLNGAQFRWGPVPALTVGCGRARVNAMFVPSPTHDVLSAIAASGTIFLKKHGHGAEVYRSRI
jgi:hypothetical protein